MKRIIALLVLGFALVASAATVYADGCTGGNCVVACAANGC